MRFAVVLAIAALVAAPMAEAAIGIIAPATASTSVTLNGFDQDATLSVSLSISGPGTGGWHITAWAAKPASGSNTLGALVVSTQPTTSCTGGGCVKASSTLSWPITLGTTSSGAVKIFNAAKSTGTGSADAVGVPFSISVPANTLTGSYTTTLTVAVATGP
jgi:hypothetical protein